MSTVAARHLARLPHWMTRWIGYRASRPPSTPHRIIILLWSFLGAFTGMTALFMIFGRTRHFQARHVPPIIASFAASAVLCFNAIQAPFSQPRALVGGHLLSALIGVCIRKLFAMLPAAKYEDLRWLSGALSCATAIVAMDVTGTTHPPAGATALLATSSDEIAEIGWLYIPVVLLSSVVVLATALVNNNVQRRYPVYWISPAPPATAAAASTSQPDSRDSTEPLAANAQKSGSASLYRSSTDAELAEKV
ncbi:HPP family-domain-containing protein [Auriculariales sp. MPI-PUGE-AT-0066]|nr:HPP family-domain-containing protein [Auriculariales sp. MPI-PUGE-AT-0066]